MKISIKAGSENYTAQVLKLPAKVQVKGFDRLVKVTYQGNDCLINKDSPEDQLYLFFPSGSVLAPEYLSANNLYRHPELNRDKTQTGLIDDSGRVKSVKMKGVISTGLIMPLYQSMMSLLSDRDIRQFKVGDSFNTVDGHDLCIKYQQPQKAGNLGGGQKKTKILDAIVDSKFVPEHKDSEHLLKNVYKLALDTNVIITVKVHGFSARVFNSPVKTKLSILSKIAKKLGVPVNDTKHSYVVGSRRVIKSVDFKTLSGKNHYYATDEWTSIAKKHFEGKLNKNEAIYFEVYGRTSTGSEIQKGYSYSLDHPEIQVYRISNINEDGIEVDLSWDQMTARCEQLGVRTVIPIFQGRLGYFIQQQKMDLLDWDINKHIKGEYDLEESLNDIFYNQLLEKPSILDPNTKYEEGFVVRIDTYPRVTAYKIKSRNFILHESKGIDTGVVDLEENN